jgi:hypothetical protein
VLKPTKIVIHHSLTKDSGTVSWSAIHSYHVNEKGWQDIGYHAGIEEANGKFICLYGRPDWLPGAHTKGQNRSSLGFCFVGNYNDSGPGDARMRVAARRVLAPWLIRYGLGVEALVPHNQFASKSCPGRMFNVRRLREICAEEVDRARVS